MATMDALGPASASFMQGLTGALRFTQEGQKLKAQTEYLKQQMAVQKARETLFAEQAQRMKQQAEAGVKMREAALGTPWQPATGEGGAQYDIRRPPDLQAAMGYGAQAYPQQFAEGLFSQAFPKPTAQPAERPEDLRRYFMASPGGLVDLRTGQVVGGTGKPNQAQPSPLEQTVSQAEFGATKKAMPFDQRYMEDRLAYANMAEAAGEMKAGQVLEQVKPQYERNPLDPVAKAGAVAFANEMNTSGDRVRAQEAAREAERTARYEQSREAAAGATEGAYGPRAQTLKAETREVTAEAAVTGEAKGKQDIPLDIEAPKWINAESLQPAPPNMTRREAKDSGYVTVTEGGLNAVSTSRAALIQLKEYRELAGRLLVKRTGKIGDLVRVQGNRARIAALRASGDPDAKRLEGLFGGIATLARATGDTANIAVQEREFLKNFVATPGDTIESATAKLDQAERILRGVISGRVSGYGGPSTANPGGLKIKSIVPLP